MISGANRGIGKAIAERLHQAGCRLSLGARDPDKLAHNIAGSMDASRVLIHPYEARDRSIAKEWAAATVQKYGCIDGLVNNAAIVHLFRAEDENEELLDEMWDVNVKGPLRLFRAAFPHLKDCGHGRVINISSLSGVRLNWPEVAGYAMTKHALMAFTHAIKFSGWEFGIRSTAICPAFVNTDMTLDVPGVSPAEMIQPESIAELVETVLALPNTASVTELPVNCLLEHSY